MNKFHSFERLAEISKNLVIGCSGEMSDFQELTRILLEKVRKEALEEDSAKLLNPQALAKYSSKISYNFRNKINPLLISTIFAGYDKSPYLAYVDPYGTFLEDNWLVSGFAHYFSKTLLTNHWHPEMNLENAIQLIMECFTVLVYRDARTGNKVQLCYIDAEGTHYPDIQEIKGVWNLQSFLDIDAPRQFKSN